MPLSDPARIVIAAVLDKEIEAATVGVRLENFLIARQQVDDLQYDSVLPRMTEAGDKRAALAVNAATFLVEYIDYLSQNIYDPGVTPAGGDISTELQIVLIEIAQMIHDRTPNKKQESR